MKKISILTLLLILTGMIYSQKDKVVKPDPEYLLYRKSLEYGDYTISRTAVLELIVKYPEKPAWKDTLLTIYGMMGMYEQAILLGEDIIKTKTNDTNTLKILAISYENLGVFNKAIEYYDKVLTLGEDLVIRYKLAVCQYGLQRYGEAKGNIDRILSNEKSTQSKVTINYESSSQDVSLVAAALNVGGIILTDTGKNEEAKMYFENALKVDENFILAQNNLKVVISLLEKGK